MIVTRNMMWDGEMVTIGTEIPNMGSIEMVANNEPVVEFRALSTDRDKLPRI